MTAFMRDGLTRLLRCDGVALLPDWSRSRGARLEVDTARGIDIRIHGVSEWLLRGTTP